VSTEADSENVTYYKQNRLEWKELPDLTDEERKTLDKIQKHDILDLIKLDRAVLQLIASTNSGTVAALSTTQFSSPNAIQRPGAASY
jgi:hypothetical protein